MIWSKLLMSLFFMALPSMFPIPFHKYYLSMTDIEVNHDAKLLKISVRLFTDDLERSLETLQTKSGKEKSKSVLSNQNLDSYLKGHFKFRKSNKLLMIKFIGFEQDAEATQCFFEVPFSGNKGKFTIINTLLFDQLKEQINLVMIHDHKSKNSFRLAYPDSLINWTLD